MAIGQTWPLLSGQRWALYVALQARTTRAEPLQALYRLPPPAPSYDAVVSAVCHVMRRHSSLRVELDVLNGEPRQRFGCAQASIARETIRCPRRQAAGALERVARREAARPIDVMLEPHLRARVVDVNGECFLIVSASHVAVDGLGMVALEQALAAALLEERKAALVGARAAGFDSYGTGSPRDGFMAFLKGEIARSDREPANLEYFIRQIADAPMGTFSTTSATAPRTRVRWVVGGASFRALEAGCRGRGCTAFTALLAAYAMFLTALDGLVDHVISFPVSNRSRPWHASVVGNLATSVWIRVSCAGGTTGLLTRVGDQVMRALAHRQYDFFRFSARLHGEMTARGGPAHYSHQITCNYIPVRTEGGAAADVLESISLPIADGSGAQAVDAGRVDLTFVHRADSVEFVLVWDRRARPASEDAVPSMFLRYLSSLVGTDLPADPPRSD